jgi:hypothetical protein
MVSDFNQFSPSATGFDEQQHYFKLLFRSPCVPLYDVAWDVDRWWRRICCFPDSGQSISCVHHFHHTDAGQLQQPDQRWCCCPDDNSDIERHFTCDKAANITATNRRRCDEARCECETTQDAVNR